MKTTFKVARLTLLGSGALLLLLGLIIWTGNGDPLIPVHVLLGFVLVLSLWTIAAIAARNGVSIGIVSLAVAWSLAIILGGAQEELLTGRWHWTIQALHLVVSMGVIGWGQRLLFLMRRDRQGARLAWGGTSVESAVHTRDE